MDEFIMSYNDYGFVLTIRPSGRTVSLHLRDIREPDGSSTRLTTLTCTALYAAVNKEVNGLHVTPTSHSLSDSSRGQTLDDDQLQGVLKYEGQHEKLFRFFLDPNPDASVNHHAVSDLPSDDSIPILQSMNESSPPITQHQQASPIVPNPAGYLSGLINTLELNYHPANSILPDLGGYYLPKNIKPFLFAQQSNSL